MYTLGRRGMGSYRRRGMGEPPADNCPAGTSLFGNPPTCVTNDIVGQAAANQMAATQGTCPVGFVLVGTGGQQFCSPAGASPTSPCDYGNVYLNGSCYPVGSTLSGGVVTQPDGTKIDANTGMVIGSYDWTVAHGGGSTVSTGPAPAPAPAPAAAAPPAPAPAPTPAPTVSTSNPVTQPSAAPQGNVMISSAPSYAPGGSLHVASSGVDFSSIPWWAYAAAAGVALFAFSK